MNLRRRMRRLFRRRQSETEMAEEMRYHLEQRAAELEADGLSAEEARLAAQRRFGNTGSIQEQAREAWGWGWFERLMKDISFAFRQLVRSPGFSILAIVTLGLGIGANTAMFSVLNGVMLKPLPYRDCEQLDRFYRATPQNPDGNISPADFLALQQAKQGYGDVAACLLANASVSEPGQPAEIATAMRVTVNLFSMLGASPQLGRDFHEGEDIPGLDRVVILSQRAWLNRFAGRPEIIGRTIRVDGEPHEVIGVMPDSFNDWRHLGPVEIFRPLALSPQQAADRTGTILRVMGRRSSAHSPAEAVGFISSFGERLAADFSEANAESTWRAVPLRKTIFPKSAPAIIFLIIGLSGFVLLIACSNLANLLLARTMARAREFAVRAALGASRLQLLRPLIAESILLALAGGVLSLFVGLWVRDWISVRGAMENAEPFVLPLDWRVMAWAFVASLVTAVAFGIAPALFALRLDLNATLKSGARGSTGGRGHQRFRQVLIIGQFAIAMILLAGAGLFIRGLNDLNNRRSGWESDRLVVGTILLPAGTYGDAEKITAFHRRVEERLASLPGVASVSISSFTPILNWPDIRRFLVEGQDRLPPGHEPAAVVNTVDPGYFKTYGTQVLAGRSFTERDTGNASDVVIISESTARGLMGNENPLGRRLAQVDGEGHRWSEIVGVVSDVQSVLPDPSPTTFQIYVPMAHEPRRQNEIAVRTLGVAPSSAADAIRAAIMEIDADLPVRNLLPADARIDRANNQLAMMGEMLSGMAALGLGLASLGIYGVMTHTMALRRGEFAIRFAMGASVDGIIRLVLGYGIRMALLGSIIGVLGALGLSRFLAAAQLGMRSGGPLILLGTTLLLTIDAMAACWIPARRAAKVDAMSALRAE